MKQTNTVARRTLLYIAIIIKSENQHVYTLRHKIFRCFIDYMLFPSNQTFKKI